MLIPSVTKKALQLLRAPSLWLIFKQKAILFKKMSRPFLLKMICLLNDGQANDEEIYNNMEFDVAESPDFGDYGNMLNVASPKTVPERKFCFFEQSISPRGLFSDYFPTTYETTPKAGYTRQPMNAGYYDRNHRMQDGPWLLVAASVNKNQTDATVDQVRHSSALWSVLLSSFANRLTNQEQTILTALLYYAQHHGLEHGSDFFPLAVPNCAAQLRQNYTDGRRSIENSDIERSIGPETA
jgi:hypothetical protein